MSAINPNDPVVTMLKEVVQQFQERLDDLAQETMEGFKMLGEGNMKVFSEIFSRLTKSEEGTVEIFQRVAKLEMRNIELQAELEAFKNQPKV
jgi:hypothetical protein